MSLSSEFEKVQDLRNNGQFEQAVVEYELIRMVAIMKNQPELAANCQQMVGVTYYQSGDWPEARVHLMRGLRGMRQSGNRLGEGAVLRDLGMNEMRRGNGEESRRFLGESIRVLMGTEHKGHLGMSRVKLGVVEAISGSSQIARAVMRRGIEEIKLSPDRWFESTGYWELAQLEAKINNPKQAIEVYDRAMELLMSLGGEKKFLERMNEMRAWRKKLTQEK